MSPLGRSVAGTGQAARRGAGAGPGAGCPAGSRWFGTTPGWRAGRCRLVRVRGRLRAASGNPSVVLWAWRRGRSHLCSLLTGTGRQWEPAGVIRLARGRPCPAHVGDGGRGGYGGRRGHGGRRRDRRRRRNHGGATSRTPAGEAFQPTRPWLLLCHRSSLPVLVVPGRSRRTGAAPPAEYLVVLSVGVGRVARDGLPPATLAYLDALGLGLLGLGHHDLQHPVVDRGAAQVLERVPPCRGGHLSPLSHGPCGPWLGENAGPGRRRAFTAE
jgi:hypothetical protein